MYFKHVHVIDTCINEMIWPYTIDIRSSKLRCLHDDRLFSKLALCKYVFIKMSTFSYLNKKYATPIRNTRQTLFISKPCYRCLVELIYDVYVFACIALCFHVSLCVCMYRSVFACIAQCCISMVRVSEYGLFVIM